MHDFAQQYNQHFNYVYRYLHFRLSSRQVAEDITSKTFLIAFEKQEQYNPEKGSWKQWITGIAKHQLLNYWQREKIPLSLEELEQAGQIVSVGIQAHHDLDKKIMLEKILESLTPNLRRLLILRYVDDLTHQDIANLTGKAPAAIRQLFSRLHKSLSSQFEQHDLTF